MDKSESFAPGKEVKTGQSVFLFLSVPPCKQDRIDHQVTPGRPVLSDHNGSIKSPLLPEQGLL